MKRAKKLWRRIGVNKYREAVRKTFYAAAIAAVIGLPYAVSANAPGNTGAVGILRVRKVIMGGGPLGFSDFSFSVNGGPATSFESDGQNDLVTAMGAYTVVEQAAEGYVASYGNCENAQVGNDTVTTCIITNTFQEPEPETGSLTVVKETAGGDGSFEITGSGGVGGF